MADEILLSTDRLCCGYHDKSVLQDVSVAFKKGKITVIAGKNGCGKSTLLKTLIRLNPKSSGEIYVAGKSIDGYNSAALARQVSYLPQNKTVPDLTVMTMVLHGRFAHLGYPRRYREEDMAIARQALAATELLDLKDSYISKLSGGQQQRVFLAMCLAQCSPVILMDEPTSFMDLSHQLKFMHLSRQLADSGKAVVMVLHDLSAALKYGDEMIVMSQGSVAAAGTPEDVYRSGILDQVFQIHLDRVETPGGMVYYC